MGDKASLEAVLDSMPVPASIIVDSDRVYVNPRFMEILDVTKREAALGPIDKHIATPEDVELVAGKLSDLEEGRSSRTEYQYRMKRHGLQPLVVEASANLVDYGGARPAVLEVLHDVTGHIDSNSALSLAFSAMSHELRTPLSVVLGYASMLKKGVSTMDASMAKAVEKLSSNLSNILVLIEAVADLARGEHIAIKKANVDFTKLGYDILEDLKEQTKEENVSYQVQPGVNAFGDIRHLRILLSNLLRNAWKFTRNNQGGRIIDVGYKPYQGPDQGYREQWAYFVRDNGAGFDPASTGKLFGLFSRLHTEREFQGTGVGLYTAKTIVQRHGGAIWAESEGIGKGATFYFTLPSSQR